MRFEGVLFDLFHTLTADEASWAKLPWTSDVLGIDRRLWNTLLLERSRWRLAGEERDPFRIIATLAREVDPAIPDALVHEAVRVRTARFASALDRIPEENLTTLRRLKQAGVRLGVVSNADVMEIAPWASSPLASLFDAVVFSCEVGHVKPEPAIFELCLTQLGLAPAQCLFVGDGGSDELAGARAVGLTPVFVSGTMQELWAETMPRRLAQATHHIVRIPEVLALVGLA